MTQHRILIVIPAFNEAESIGAVIESLDFSLDIVVLDDGSTDNTADVSAKCGATVVSHTQNQGYEAALRTAYSYARGHDYTFMLTMDGDGQHPSSSIPDFVEELQNGASLVIGVRPALNRLGEKFLKFFTKNLICVEDPYCGMKGYNLKKIGSLTFSRYNSIGTSLIFSLCANGDIISNINISCNQRVGASKFGNMINSEFRIFPSAFIGVIRAIYCFLKLKFFTGGK